jgi:hypothetical protein
VIEIPLEREHGNVTDQDRGFAREFLFKIIDDNQSTIRSIDTKAGFAIAVLGAMIGKALDGGRLSTALTSRQGLPIVLALSFSVLTIYSAALAFKTVLPMINPAEHVSIPSGLRPPFFISQFKTKRYLHLFTSSKKYASLEETHASYSSSVSQASAAEIESVLSAEVLKLSFIRQMKTDRLTALATALVITVIAFVVFIATTPQQRNPNGQQSPQKSAQDEGTPMVRYVNEI